MSANVDQLKSRLNLAICKSRNGESRIGMRGMREMRMGIREIWMGIREMQEYGECGKNAANLGGNAGNHCGNVGMGMWGIELK